MPVDIQTYEIISNFCTDYKIENVPKRENMYFEIIGVEGLHAPQKVEAGISYLANELYLAEVESVSGNGTLLMVGATSPALEELAMEYYDEFDGEGTISEEPSVSVIISYDYEKGNDDLTFLEMKLKEYTNDVLKFSEIKTQYTTDEDLVDFILDGREPIQN
jgi:hypothetical protein